MKPEHRESYGDDDVPLKAKGSPFPNLHPTKVKIGRCLNCKKRFEFYPSSWSDKLYCCDACGVAYRKKQRTKKAKQPPDLTSEEVVKARLRRKAHEQDLAFKASVALWDLKRAEEIRQQQRAREEETAATAQADTETAVNHRSGA